MALPTGVGYAEATATNPSASLTDFTLLVDLSKMPADWWNAIDTADEEKLRVANDSGTELPRDVISFTDNEDGTGSGWVRVKWSGTLSNTGTQKLRVYPPQASLSSYAASATFGQHNAYDADWLQYLPLDGDANDRTGNGNNGTLSSLAFPTDEISGQVGSGLDLDGSGDGQGEAGDYIEALPDNSSLEGDDSFTVLAWCNAASQSSSDEDTIFSNFDANRGSIMLRYDSNSNELDAFAHDGSSNNGHSNGVTVEGAWHQFGFRLVSGTLSSFLDGSKLTNDSTSVGSMSPAATSSKFFWGATGHNNTDGWLGGLDELQIHTAGRSNAWIDEEYDQSSDQNTFWGLGGGTWTWVPATTQVHTPPIASYTLTGIEPASTKTAAAPLASLTSAAPVAATTKTATAPVSSFTVAGLGPATQKAVDAPGPATASLAGILPGLAKRLTPPVPSTGLTGILPGTIKQTASPLASLTLVGVVGSVPITSEPQQIAELERRSTIAGLPDRSTQRELPPRGANLSLPDR